ncbi:hypothetical protein [Almyronema epifaneia]|uniref:PEP-CTERM sorting domain-containing protein n=1 Tax=Almyronema epifaneia S1 TaxID=2991925 RepID=A0ABW6IEW3_9CYAN
MQCLPPTKFLTVFTAAAVLVTATYPIANAAKVEAATLDIGHNFTSSTLFIDSNLIPPSPSGSVGSKHVIEFINGGYKVYEKSTGALVESSTLDQFWLEAGVNFQGFTFDPRVVYDPFSQRWLAAAVDNPNANNQFLLAVSNSADPLSGWTGFAIDSDSSDQRWADFPTLGFDKSGVYLTANMFPQPGKNAASLETHILAIPKADLLGMNPTVAQATLFESNLIAQTGFSLQPSINLDNANAAVLLSSLNAQQLKPTRIENVATQPTLETTEPAIALDPFAPIFSADQPGPKQDLEIGGDRLSTHTVTQNGAVWGVQTVEQAGRAALRWFQIDAATGQLLQEGLIADPENDFYYGSIAVNDYEDVVIGFNASGPNQFVSAYAITGQTAGNATTFSDPLLLKAGVSDYEVTFGAGRNRWGDYSATTLDPADQLTFWTFQEYVSAEDRWSTQITELKLRPDFDPTQLVNAGFEAGLAGWLSRGNVQPVTAAIGADPVAGQFQAALATSGEVLGDDSLEAFLQLPPDSLGAIENTVGSAIRQSFFAQAGDILTLNWQLLTQGLALDPSTSAFVSISRLSQTFEVIETQLFNLLTDPDRLTGSQTFSFVVPTTGTYSLGIGLITADATETTQLLIDNVSLKPQPPTEVPEGGMGWGLALVGLGLGKKRLWRLLRLDRA